jgi:hypothetical protein
MTGQQIFYRIPINSTDGTPADEHFRKDDLDSAGNAYVGQSVNDTVAKVTPDGV